MDGTELPELQSIGLKFSRSTNKTWLSGVPMRRLAALLLVPLVSCASGSPPSPAPAPGVPVTRAGIGAEELRRDLLAFADDSMRGRETGTVDADRAALFLVERVRALGLEPAGDSLYYQRVPLMRETFAPATRVVVQEGGVSTPLRIGHDVAPLLTLAEGLPPTRRHAKGEIVFVSYGLTTRNPRRDDFAGLDLEGKVVVVVNGAPAGADSASRAQLEAQAAISDRLAQILPQRPEAVVILLAGKGRELFERVAPQLERGVSTRTSAPEVPESERQIPLILLGVATPGSPLLPPGWPADDRARPLGRRLVADVEQQRTPVTGYNVAAVVRGSDPELSMTYVAFGAHYDHIGVVPPVRGDSIANGADDDGSGSVSLLAIARAMQAAPVKPKRSVLFVWHVGEEKGLLGSSWFVDHPTVPIDSIVAQLNADMIGRNAPDLLYLVGPRSAPNAQSRRLGAVVDSVNAAEGRPFAVDRSFDSPEHPEHIYERSDHFNYARKGIPIVFFTTGLHDDYHRPSDEVSKIDFEKMARVDQLLLDVGLAVANGGKRPK
jgi:hypothetical protein